MNVELTREMVVTIGASLVWERRRAIRLWLECFDCNGASEFWAREIRDINDAHYAILKGSSLVD